MSKGTKGTKRNKRTNKTKTNKTKTNKTKTNKTKRTRRSRKPIRTRRSRKPIRTIIKRHYKKRRQITIITGSQSVPIFTKPPRKQSLKILVSTGDNKQFGSLIPGLRDL